MDLENIPSNFKIIDFVPYNLQKIINNLDFKFCTFTFLNFHSMNFTFINSNTFHTTKNAVWNFVNLKFKITMHQNNSFNYLYELIDTQIKNSFKLTHKMVLLEIENIIFYIINELLNKPKKFKKTRVWIEQLFDAL